MTKAMVEAATSQGAPAEVAEADIVDRLIAMIDEDLARVSSRELVSAGDVMDMLLDLRLVLATAKGTDERVPVRSS
ncbi:MAG: hypothetical protein KatS3mg008_0629 [Acidimicrobiales bacterium]|nr:MAG: hypothetical protein KatS3mg008_0629 [Acidimicrobiales bacterium]